ncbi:MULTISPECIES: hypothetical protein [unclassified Lysinibacillus]|uniref:hypothetical protein n=1 Tax=unclassified Lysinibacillus TaxID=2636778 RepID=UPI003808395E
MKNKDSIVSFGVAIGAAVLAFEGFSIVQGVILGIQNMVKAFKAYQIANEGATVAQWTYG